MADVITVTALNRYVKTLLDCDDVLCDLALRGEISNFVHHRSGHFYFSLKDSQCAVKAVMFQRYAQQIAFLPQNGMRVIVRCRVSLFERDGAFQVYVDDMFPDGVGAMQLAFDQLKEKLEREGLFAPEHKRPLPAAPRCVGLVTSRTGAALQDILNVTRRRYPVAHFLLAPVTVQGNEAAPEIADAITRLGRSGRVDVIIVARGGGSREDLWVFNSEGIARAAYACPVPVVSAIGHEIDFSILDFVADLRAPTPSAAAELVMPDLGGKMRETMQIYANIAKEMKNRLLLCYNMVQEWQNAPQLTSVRNLPAELSEETAEKSRAVQQAMHARLHAAEQALRHAAALCDSLSPYQVLARGYAIARRGKQVLKTAADAKAGDRLEIQLTDGRLGCTVHTVMKEKSLWNRP